MKNLTISAKRVSDQKYKNDPLALALDFNCRKLLASLQAATDLTTADLSRQAAGSDEVLRLQAQQLEQR